MFQHRNVATSSTKDVEITRWVNRHSADQRRPNQKVWNCIIFCIFMYIYEDFSDFLWCFLFAEILPNHATVSELPNLSLSKAFQVLSTNVTNFNQTTVCSHRHHWGIGVPGCTLASLIHARAIPSSSWVSAPPVTTGSVLILQWALPQSALQKRRWC